jgi:hypothetical protein
LKLKYDEALSHFAFNFHLRRYIKGAVQSAGGHWEVDLNKKLPDMPRMPALPHITMPTMPHISIGIPASAGAAAAGAGAAEPAVVGPCRLTVSKPVVNAPMIPALEAKIS